MDIPVPLLGGSLIGTGFSALKSDDSGLLSSEEDGYAASFGFSSPEETLLESSKFSVLMGKL
jgi:hypothetical protein